MVPAQKIKEIREKIKHQTQAEFAAEYGLKLNTIRFIEQGKQDIPDNLALVLEKEFGISFKWWKTGKGSMYIEQEEYLGATGTYNQPHLRVIKSDYTARAEIVKNIGIAEKEIEIFDDEKLKEIAKKLGKSITVEYVEDDRKNKTCEFHPDGQVVECPAREKVTKIDLDNLIGQYLTALETEQLAKTLKNNKTFLFIFIEKLNTSPHIAKQILLELENQ